MNKALVWFRRDLRDFDHAALYHALKQNEEVYCVFVFDSDILDALTQRQDRRVEFIWESVRELKAELQCRGGDLLVRHGQASKLVPALARELEVNTVYCNRDYEAAANQRDAAVSQALAEHDIDFLSFKDQVIFECDEILTKSNSAFSVFTPYKNACLRTLNDFYLKPYPVDRYFRNLAERDPEPMPELEDLGFERSNLAALKLPTGMSGGSALFEDFVERMPQYRQARDFPGRKGPSYLSVHLRFGTVSIRHLARTVGKWVAKVPRPGSMSCSGAISISRYCITTLKLPRVTASSLSLITWLFPMTKNSFRPGARARPASRW